MPIQSEAFCNNYINTGIMGTPAYVEWPTYICVGDGMADRVQHIFLNRYLWLWFQHLFRAPVLVILEVLLLFKRQAGQG